MVTLDRYRDTDTAPRQVRDPEPVCIGKPYGDTVNSMGEGERATKSLTAEQNAAVRAVVQRIVDGEFDGNIRAASDALGIGYATLNDLYNGKAGAGNKTVAKLADHAGMSMDEVLGRAHRPADRGHRPVYGNSTGWVAAEAVARTKVAAASLDERDFVEAREFSGVIATGEITPEFVLSLAMAARELRLNPGPSAEDRKLDAQIKGLRTKAERKLERQRANETSGPLQLEPPAPKRRKKGTTRE